MLFKLENSWFGPGKKANLSQLKNTLRSLIPRSILFWVQSFASFLLFSSTPYLISILFSTELSGEFLLISRFFYLLVGDSFCVSQPLLVWALRCIFSGRCFVGPKVIKKSDSTFSTRFLLH